MSELQHLNVLVIGAGFNGVYQLHKLRKAGFSVKVFEAGSGLGGVWYWNCYPGARVDTEFSDYQFSLKELWKDWNWTERFPGQQELIKYFNYIDRKLDLSRDIFFNTQVTSASFDATTNHWSVFTKNGITAKPRFLILCTGFASKPLFPNIPGLDTFQGAMHHTSLWPQVGHDMVGKRVGVIGTGASGIQVIQETASIAAHLTIFQRTPNLALPMNQHHISVDDQTRMKEEMYPILFKRREQTFTGFHYDHLRPGNFYAMSPEERYIFLDDMWKKGGFHYWLGSFGKIFSDQKVNDEVYAFWRKKVLVHVQNPEIQRKLAPETPPHLFGVKRVSLEQCYYEVFNRTNVALIDVNENPIVEVTPKGVKTQDGVEIQGDWIVDCLAYLRQHNYIHVDAKLEASEAWVQRVADIFSKGLFGRTKSWYTGANVPEKRVKPLIFVGGVPLYTSLIQESAQNGYTDFTLTPGTTKPSSNHCV
ncbi:hypothetical protein C0992_009895 [Termitomyces sp. T32_za158]|nr:hypothetical protein C0992_009895 [Termitomyces sp. T32_za158]